MNSLLDIHFKRFTPCVIICPCDKWLSQHYMVAISKDGLVKSYKERSKHIAIDTGDLVLTLVNYQASYYKVFASLKYIK